MARKTNDLYRYLIYSLENERLYTPALIVQHAIGIGLLKAVEKEQRRRIRHNMARRSTLSLGKEDGLIIGGNGLHKAWFGASWKILLNAH